jgi:hypothetical protein
VLLKLLVSNNMDGILEAVRVFGNLSQDHDICDFIVQNNGELMTIKFISMHFLPVIGSVVPERREYSVILVSALRLTVLCILFHMGGAQLRVLSWTWAVFPSLW